MPSIQSQPVTLPGSGTFSQAVVPPLNTPVTTESGRSAVHIAMKESKMEERFSQSSIAAQNRKTRSVTLSVSSAVETHHAARAKSMTRRKRVQRWHTGHMGAATDRSDA
jgi:hypothetical protein